MYIGESFRAWLKGRASNNSNRCLARYCWTLDCAGVEITLSTSPAGSFSLLSEKTIAARNSLTSSYPPAWGYGGRASQSNICLTTRVPSSDILES